MSTSKLCRHLRVWLGLLSVAIFLFSVTTPAVAQDKDDSTATVANGNMEQGEIGQPPEGWKFNPGSEAKEVSATLTDDQSNEGEFCCRIEGAGKKISNLLQSFDASRYEGRRVRLQASIRCDVEGSNLVSMWMRVDKPRKPNQAVGEMMLLDNMEGRPIRSSKWNQYAIVADIPKGAGAIYIGFFVRWKGVFWIDDVSIEVVDKDVKVTTDHAKKAAQFKSFMNAFKQRKERSRSKPGIYHITGSREVKFRTFDDAIMVSPLPLAYRDQVPISYEYTVTPESAIKSLSIEKDKLENYVARLTLKPGADTGTVQVGFRSTVLVGPSDFELPDQKFPLPLPEEWPAEAQPWLKSTWCVGADTDRFAELAGKIVGETEDVLQIIELAKKEARAIRSKAKGRGKNLTAEEALDHKGSCTSCGNLYAAILRSCNVPARVLSGYPSWSGPLQTHYIVEAYLPDYGWYPIESTLLVSPWPNSGQINVAIVPVEYETEELSGRRIPNAGGVPYLSLTEQTGRHFFTKGNIPDAEYCDHVCKLSNLISDEPEKWDAVLDESKSRWQAWLDEQQPVKTNICFGEEGHLTGVNNLDDVK